MKKIEEGLTIIHGIAGNKSESTSTSRVADDSCVMDTNEVLSEPFLRVNLVTAGSPAEQAVRQFIFLLL